MNGSLHQLIAKRGFDRFRPGLEARFGAFRLSYKICYGDSPPNCSLLVRMESSGRLGEICAWESGDCDVQRASLDRDGIATTHYSLKSDDEFHDRLADLCCFVAKRGVYAEEGRKKAAEPGATDNPDDAQ